MEMKKSILMVAAMATALGSIGSLSDVSNPVAYIAEPTTTTDRRTAKGSRTNQRKRRKGIRQVPQLLRAKANRK